MSASRDPVRWGVLGTGGINRRFLARAHEASGARFVAVGSRSEERAAAFAREHGLERAHGSYEALLADADVDVVYICLPNSLHHPWTMRALAAGKHVLCEKPYTRRPAEVMEAFDAAEAAGLVLMEAFMWRHSIQLDRLLALLPEIGELRAVRASFSFNLDRPADIRLRPELDGGSLMDVGTYCVSAARVVTGSEPDLVVGRQHLGPSGVDVAFTGLLAFPGGVDTTILSGFTADHSALEAIGSRATLRLPEFWNGRATTIWLDERPIAVTPVDPYLLEIENMTAAVRGDEEPRLGRSDALGQALALEALYRSAESGLPARPGEVPG